MEHQVDGKDVSSLRVVDLKVELEKRGLSKSGTKNQLAERLIAYLDSHPEESGAQEVENEDDESSNSVQEVTPQQDDSEGRERAEQEAKAERERQEQEAKAERERQEQAAQAERERHEQAAQAERDRQEQAAKAERERHEQAAKAERERQEQAAKAERERLEQEAKAEKEQQEEIARAKREQEAKAEQEKKAKAERERQEKEAKAEQERQEKEAKAKRERQEEHERLERERLQLEVEQQQERKAALEASERQEIEKMTKLRQEKARLEEEVRLKAEAEKREREEKERAVAAVEENDDDDAIVVNTTEIISDDDDLSQEPKISHEKPKKSSPEKSKSESAKSSSPEKTTSETEKSEISPPKQDEEPIHFRRLLSRKSESSSHPKESRKGTWSSRAKDDSAASTCLVSSSQLKDIIPDIRPFLEENAESDDIEKETRLEETSVKGSVEKEEGEVVEKMEVIEEEIEVESPQSETIEKNETSVKISKNGNSHHKNGVDHVDAVDKLPKPIVEKKSVNKISEANTLNSSVVSIKNLVRPFTEAQLRECLKRTGKIVDNGFWINKIKSHAIVQYSSPDEAEETVAALDGVRWPSTNPKQLTVTFSDEETLRAAQEGAPVAESRAQNEDQNNRNKRPAIAERADERDHDHQRDYKRKRLESDKPEEPVPQRKSLDELFRKTKAQPCIYWLPKEPLETKSLK